MNRAKPITETSIRVELSEKISNEVSYKGASYADELGGHLANVLGTVDVMHQVLISFPPNESLPKKSVDLTLEELSGFFGLLSRELVIARHLVDAIIDQELILAKHRP